MKDNKEYPILRFKGMEKLWNTVLLGNLTKIYDGTHQTPKYVKSGVPFYSVEHVTANKFDKTKFISEEVFKKENKRVRLEKGDILMTRIGSIGVAKLIDWDVRASFYVSLALIKNDANFNSKFLTYYIQTRTFQRELWKRTIHVAFPQKINLGEIGECKVKLPSGEEQQKIASFLSSVDERIELMDRKKEKLEAYKKGVMQQIFSQRIRFKQDDGSSFPDWGEMKAKDVFQNISNKKHNGDLPILSASQELGMVLREENGIKIQATEKSVTSYKIVEPDDFVISLRSFQGGLDHSRFLGICSPAYTVLRNKIPVEAQFYKFYFKKESFITRLSQTVVGIRDGKQITFDNFGQIKIPYPSVQEQNKIAAFLNSIDENLEMLDSQIQSLRTWKKGLLQQMFV